MKKKIYFLLIGVTSIFNSCKKDIDPDEGFTKLYYFKTVVDSTEYKFEEDDLFLGLIGSSGSGYITYGFSSSFGLYYDSEGEGGIIQIEFDHKPTEEDIKNLEGKEISFSSTQYPNVRIDVIRNGFNNAISTLDVPDQTGSSFKVDKVIKYKKEKARDWDQVESNVRIYILRGAFNCIGDHFGGGTSELITEGQFSIKVAIFK